jgi:hypothetical protein
MASGPRQPGASLGRGDSNNNKKRWDWPQQTADRGGHTVAQTIEGFVGTSLDTAKISPLHIKVIALIAAG